MVFIKKKVKKLEDSLEDYFEERESTVKLCKEVPLYKIKTTSTTKCTIVSSEKVENINLVRTTIISNGYKRLNGEKEDKPD